MTPSSDAGAAVSSTAGSASNSNSFSTTGSDTEQPDDEFRGDPVEAGNECGENHDIDEHDDRILDGRLARRPRDLLELLSNLPQELAGARAFFGFGRGGRLAALRDRVAVAVDVARTLQHASLLAVEGHESLELVRGGIVQLRHAYPI